MPANSRLRRLAKGALAPVLGPRTYKYIQAASIARDIRSGAFSEPELDLVPRAVRQGEVALDLGANLGMYTVPLARSVGSGGRVYAFEPIPFTVETLRVVLRLTRVRNVEVVPKACGESPGTMTFRVPLQNSGALSTGQAHLATRDDERAGGEDQVRWDETTEATAEVVRIDDVVPSEAEVSLVKADIEGAEFFAFNGGVQTIERTLPTVICEINPWFLEGFGLSVDRLTAFFSDREYGLYAYGGEGRGLQRIDDLNDVTEDNYVFVHPSRLDRLRDLLNR